eukprot:4272552-Pleurochrysis_carterae.AAC.2
MPARVRSHARATLYVRTEAGLHGRPLVCAHAHAHTHTRTRAGTRAHVRMHTPPFLRARALTHLMYRAAFCVSLQPDPLRGLLPPALTTALQKHFDDIESKLYALTTRSSEDALRCQEALSSHRMPEALEACETDTKLPERILRVRPRTPQTQNAGQSCAPSALHA